MAGNQEQAAQESGVARQDATNTTASTEVQGYPDFKTAEAAQAGKLMKRNFNKATLDAATTANQVAFRTAAAGASSAATAAATAANEADKNAATAEMQNKVDAYSSAVIRIGTNYANLSPFVFDTDETDTGLTAYLAQVARQTNR